MHMKKLIIVLVLLNTFLALGSDPTNLPLSSLGQGTKLVATQDLLIPASTSFVFFTKGRLYNNFDELRAAEGVSSPNTIGYCLFALVRSPENRFIKASDSLTVKLALTDRSVNFSSPKALRELACYNPNGKETIGFLLEQLGDLFEFVPQAPTPL